MIKKGIILAGGMGTRMSPLTKAVNKQLLPIYDKPLIFYPLSILMLAKIKDILIISTPYDIPSFEKLFGDGSSFGINICYEIQPEPKGIAQAFLIGEDFLSGSESCLTLGDNIFYGSGLQKLLVESVNHVTNKKEAIVFGTYVTNPKDYAVAGFDNNKTVVSLEEKPEFPKSNYAVDGLYFYPNSVVNIAKTIKPSDRGELEITSVNVNYLQQNQLKMEVLKRGFAWLDTGTHEALSEATEFVKAIEKRTGQKVACPEEIALQMGWISKTELAKRIANLKGDYYAYLKEVIG